MPKELFAALVSLCSFFYASYLSHTTKVMSDKVKMQRRLNDATLYTLLGLFAMILSFL